MGNGGSVPASKGKRAVRNVIMAKRLFSELFGLWSTEREYRQKWKDILDNSEAVVRQKMSKIEQELKDGSDVEFLKLFEGDIPEKHVSRPSKDICIFISSTFTDMLTERDLFMEDVYPYLKKFCQRLGYSFTVSDMRWGVRDESSDEHQTFDICRSEVERCRKVSVGPFFLCIVGEKYGFRPFPTEIETDIFDMLITNVQHQGGEGNENCKLLRKWFKEDRNCTPPCYVLQPVSSHYPNTFKGYSKGSPMEGKVKEDAQAWWNEFAKIQMALQEASLGIDFSLCKQTKLTEISFIVSLTEREIREAFINKDNYSDRKHRVFAFFRHIEGLDEDSQFAKRYLDRVSDNLVSEKSPAMLIHDLKGYLEDQLPPEDIYRYSLKWSPNSKGHMNVIQNSDSLLDLCDQFCQYMVDAIQDAVAVCSVNEDPLHTEILQHSIFVRERSEMFFGRQKHLNQVEKYLSNPAVKPLIVHGFSGRGKTSIMAKAYSLSIERAHGVEVGRPFHIIRFLGISPSSTTALKLLKSICDQISVVLDGMLPFVRHSMDALVTCFNDLLKRASAEKPFVIFLDALDQLNDQDDGRALHWLPTQLPKNVHIVVSTLPDVGGCLAALKTKIKPDTFAAYYMEVETLDTSDVESILEKRLKHVNRSLTYEQRRLVLEACAEPSALYLKLVCDAAQKWRSFTPHEIMALKPSPTEMIQQLFERLEHIHGEEFVRHSLGYITASNYGLSNNELLDILSCDDIVLDDKVFKHYTPSIRRLPPLLWSILRNALSDYLVEVSAGGEIVYRWYHRQFYQAARSCFLSDRSVADSLHAEMANYFLGRWAYQPKVHTVQSKSGKTDDDVLVSSYRMVSPQPVILNANSKQTKFSFSEHDQSTTNILYNLRKLAELPFHLIKSGMWTEFVENICTIPWIDAKCRSGRTFELCTELALASSKCTIPEKRVIIEDFYYLIRANNQLLHSNPELLIQQALCRPDSSVVFRIAQEYLLRNGDIAGHCWMELTKAQSLDPYMVTYRHTAPVKLCVFSKDCKYLATHTETGILSVYKVSNGSVLMSTPCSATTLAFPAIADCSWIAVASENNIIRYCLRKQGGGVEGSVLQKISVDVSVEEGSVMCISKKGKAWQILLVTHVGKIRAFSTLEASKGRVIIKEEIPRRPQAIACSPDGKSVAFISGTVSIWMINSQKNIRHFETGLPGGKKNNHSDGNCAVAFSSGGSKLAAVLTTGTYIWTVSTGKQTKQPISLNCLAISFGIFSPDLELLAAPDLNNTGDFKLLMIGKQWETIRGHSGKITTCAFGVSGRSGCKLLATASKDNTVQLWDTRYLPVPRESKYPSFKSEVSGCIFSGDSKLAITTSSVEGHWVWEIKEKPCKIYTLATTGSDNGNIECFSPGNDFVVAYSDSGVHIWHLKSGFDINGVDRNLINGAHRRITLLQFHHACVQFTSDGLYSCTVSKAEPHVATLVQVLANHVLVEWSGHGKGEAPPNLDQHTLNKTAFDCQPGDMITTAALSADASTFALILVPYHEGESSYTGDTYISIWDVQSQQNVQTILSSHITVNHCVKCLDSKFVVFFQEKESHFANKRRRYTRRKTDLFAMDEQRIEGIVQVLNEKGQTLQQTRTSGKFSQLFNKDSTGQFLIGGIDSGVAKVVTSENGELFCKYALNSTDIVSFNLSSDMKYGVVGGASGQVHFYKRMDS